MWVCACECRYQSRSDVCDPLEAGITGGCELPNVHAGTRTLVLCYISKCLNHQVRSLAFLKHDDHTFET